jgi:trk system potassium uptake protein TrkA
LGLQEGSVRGMCLINDNSFQRLAGKFGMEVAINPRAITVSSILGQVRRGRIIRVHAIGDGGAEALEAEVLEGSVLLGQKLRDLDLPDGIRFGAMVRADELITPRGGTEIKIGDRIVVFALSNAIEDVERLFPASRLKK